MYNSLISNEGTGTDVTTPFSEIPSFVHSILIPGGESTPSSKLVTSLIVLFELSMSITLSKAAWKEENKLKTIATLFIYDNANLEIACQM